MAPRASPQRLALAAVTNFFMKCLIQRVSSASVSVNQEVVGNIGIGMLVLVGFSKGDSSEKLAYHIDKLLKLRIFADETGKMNRSIIDIGGSLLVVSQFTLAADCKKGTRPSFDSALEPKLADTLYQQFIKQLSSSGCPVETGIFAADMAVSLINDGPVTFLLEN